MAGSAWEWDPSLYSGSAGYYARGRIAYPRAIADTLATRLGRTGAGASSTSGAAPAR